MLQISDLQRNGLTDAHRLESLGDVETLVGLTFEESVFYLSFLQLRFDHGMLHTRSARHFDELEARHRQALRGRAQCDEDDGQSIPGIVAL